MTFANQQASAACLQATQPCAAGSRETAAATVTLPPRCAPCVLGLTFQPEAGRRVCAETTTCSFDSFESTAPTLTSDRGCTQLRVCAPGAEYEVEPPTATTDRRCGTATRCRAALEFEAAPLTATTDRRCERLTTCVPGLEHEVGAPSAVQDRVCRANRNCTALEYETQPPTATSDRACTRLSQCNATQEYETAPPTATSDRICAPLTQCAFASEYEAVLPTRTSDRTCTPLSAPCVSGTTFEAQAPGPRQDRRCQSCRTCPAGQHRTGEGCAGAVDTQCVPCVEAAACANGTFLAGTCEPTAVQGPRCEPCHESCATCTGPGPTQCLSCGGQLALLAGACVGTCGVGRFDNAATGRCESCQATCRTCRDAEATGCLSCFNPATNDSLARDAPAGTHAYLHEGLCLESLSSAFYRNQATGAWSSCTVCAPGEAETQACGDFTDTVCTPCTLGVSYQPDAARSSCLNATVCAPGTREVIAATLTSDRTCEPCDPAEGE